MNHIIFFTLLYITGVFQFLGSQELLLFCHYSLLAIGLYAFLKQFILGKSRSPATWMIGMYCIIFPIYAAYKSHEIFGQSFFLGIVSLRYCLAITFGFVLYQMNYDYKLLLKQINLLNLWIVIISIIVFFFFNINHITIQSYITSNNLTELSASADNIKGEKLYACGNLLIISYVYYLLRFLGNPTNKKNWIPFLLLMFYLCFVNKGRQPLAALAVVFAVYYVRMKGISFKRIALALLPILGVIFISIIDEHFFEKFTVILDSINTRDSSTMARINSINKVLPYIYDNVILGFGNLSVHFRELGFHSFFGKAFYIADIGVFGTLARGGIILLLIYWGIYRALYQKTKEINDIESRLFMRYMLLTFIIMLVFLCNDTLFSENSICIALIFYPLFATKNPNIFFQYDKEKILD